MLIIVSLIKLVINCLYIIWFIYGFVINGTYFIVNNLFCIKGAAKQVWFLKVKVKLKTGLHWFTPPLSVNTSSISIHLSFTSLTLKEVRY